MSSLKRRRVFTTDNEMLIEDDDDQLERRNQKNQQEQERVLLEQDRLKEARQAAATTASYLGNISRSLTPSVSPASSTSLDDLQRNFGSIGLDRGRSDSMGHDVQPRQHQLSQRQEQGQRPSHRRAQMTVQLNTQNSNSGNAAGAAGSRKEPDDPQFGSDSDASIIGGKVKKQNTKRKARRAASSKRRPALASRRRAATKAKHTRRTRVRRTTRRN
jgi:hypothetical protein